MSNEVLQGIEGMMTRALNHFAKDPKSDMRGASSRSMLRGYISALRDLNLITKEEGKHYENILFDQMFDLEYPDN